jgi:hypothetical protein
MTERPLRVAVLSPQPTVAEALHSILGSMSGGVEFVHFDCSKPDPDVVFYDAIGLLCCAATDLKMLIDKTTSHLLSYPATYGPGWPPWHSRSAPTVNFTWARATDRSSRLSSPP